METPWDFLTPPWGFRATSRGVVCISTHAERQARAALGEFAIGLFERLGITAAQLEDIKSAPDPLAVLVLLTGKNREVGDVHECGEFGGVGPGAGADDQLR